MASFEPNQTLASKKTSRKLLEQFSELGAMVTRAPAKHRARTKPEQKRRRRHAARLRSVTMRSLTCHLNGVSSSDRWAS